MSKLTRKFLFERDTNQRVVVIEAGEPDVWEPDEDQMDELEANFKEVFNSENGGCLILPTYVKTKVIDLNPWEDIKENH